MNRDDSERVERYRETIRQAWSHGDSNTWPVKLNASLHLFAKPFGEEVISAIAQLRSAGWSLAEIARPFVNPARLFRIIDTTVYSMRRNRYSLAEQRAVVLTLLDMTRALKYGSEFNEDGRNVIYDPAKAESIAVSILDEPIGTRADSQLVHRFCSIMWAYTEAIFFRAHDVTKEIHGPYAYEDGSKQFVVQEYLNLRPTELWPDVPLLPCRTIKVYKQYSRDVHIRIDALNHLYHDGGQLVPSLECCAVEVDGARRALSVLASYFSSAQATVTAISRAIDGMSWNERVMKYAEIFWFRKKPLSHMCERDWHVPAAVREAVRSGTENERRRQQLSSEASERLAMLTI